MTVPLHDLLEELASSEPPSAAGLADRAWADGRARRRRRLRVATAAAATTVVLLGLGLALPDVDLPVPRFAAASVVDGHPERIGRQLWVRPLPDRPGPVAALLQSVEQRETSAEPDGWYAVAADGHRWELPWDDGTFEVRPALSADGRRLGLLLPDGGPYVVQDLVTGRRTVFEDVGARSASPATSDGPVAVLPQHPAAFSPDGRRIAVHSAFGVVLLDVVTGTTDRVPQQDVLAGLAGRAVLAGFAGPDRLAWLVDERPEPAAAGRARLVLSDLDGAPEADVPLRPEGLPLPHLSQFAGQVSPDGQVLAVVDERRVRRFSTSDGAELSPPVEAPLAAACAAAFGPTSSTLVVSTVSDGVPAGRSLLAERVEAASTRTQTVVSDDVGGRCLLWAAAALGGPSRASGTLSWPVLLLSGGAAVAGLLALRRRRRT